ncbi:MAG TPA: hypothetical protein DEH78_28575 [Solibacterales bacterium]|nr:hypothetical protein [Bryobacterales bacterium]
MTVYELFQRALLREAPPPPAITVEDEARYRAGFTVTVREGRVIRAEYRATTCVTLVALCEELSHMVLGMDREAARAVTSESLLALHPEIPLERLARAALAVRAFQAALAEAHS